VAAGERHVTRAGFTGGCQCGAVRYRAAALRDDAHLCHCRMCQKAVGNAFAAFVGTLKADLAWTRGAPARFRSSDHVERGFCAACGTPLTYEVVDGPNMAITIGSLDDPEAVPPLTHDGIEGRLAWFARLANLPVRGVTGTGGYEAIAEVIRRSSRQHPDHDTDAWPPEDTQ